MQFYGCEMKFINRLKWIRQISLAGWLLILFSLHNFPRPFCRIDLMGFSLNVQEQQKLLSFFSTVKYSVFSQFSHSQLVFIIIRKKKTHGYDTIQITFSTYIKILNKQLIKILMSIYSGCGYCCCWFGFFFNYFCCWLENIMKTRRIWKKSLLFIR